MTAPTITVKRCPQCGETKSADGFYRDRSKRDGLDTQCKECRRAYYEDHREEKLASNRAYREAHGEELRARDRDRNSLLGNPKIDRWQEITTKHATRRGRWSEAEDAYLATSTDRIVDDALALKRAYHSVSHRIRTLRARGITLARDDHRR